MEDSCTNLVVGCPLKNICALRADLKESDGGAGSWGGGLFTLLTPEVERNEDLSQENQRLLRRVEPSGINGPPSFA